AAASAGVRDRRAARLAKHRDACRRRGPTGSERDAWCLLDGTMRPSWRRRCQPCVSPAGGMYDGHVSERALLERAHAERPASWLDDATFVAHARMFAATDAELDASHAGDLYLACACAHGVADALAAL